MMYITGMIKPFNNVEVSEIEVPFVLDKRSKNEGLDEIREKLKASVNIEIGQPISHRIDHMLSGTRANIASNIKDILFNEPNEITLILQDTLEKGHFIDILDFPFPQSMVDEDGYFYGEMTVTLVTSPILEVSQGAEYCQSNIDVMIGSYDEKVERDMSNPLIKNPIGAGGRQNILAMTNYSSRAKKDIEMPFATERMLVTYGDKFQPVKKWSVNLDEFTEGNKEKFLIAPKNWYLKVEGLYRHFMEKSKAFMEMKILYTLESLAQANLSYDAEFKVTEADVSLVNSYVQLIESTFIKSFQKSRVAQFNAIFRYFIFFYH